MVSISFLMYKKDITDNIAPKFTVSRSGVRDYLDIVLWSQSGPVQAQQLWHPRQDPHFSLLQQVEH